MMNVDPSNGKPTCISYRHKRLWALAARHCCYQHNKRLVKLQIILTLLYDALNFKTVLKQPRFALRSRDKVILYDPE